ncbi:MAG: hypothetical protein GY696_17600 [Gammaproteobacteria bacterium]|nr:hypothetical protein [Gammaproteobacteria bacterium]
MVVSNSRDWVFAGQNGSLIIPTGDDQAVFGGSSDNSTPDPSPTDRHAPGLRLRNAIAGFVPETLRKSDRESTPLDVPSFPGGYVNSEGECLGRFRFSNATGQFTIQSSHRFCLLLVRYCFSCLG